MFFCEMTPCPSDEDGADKLRVGHDWRCNRQSRMEVVRRTGQGGRASYNAESRRAKRCVAGIRQGGRDGWQIDRLRRNEERGGSESAEVGREAVLRSLFSNSWEFHLNLQNLVRKMCALLSLSVCILERSP